MKGLAYWVGIAVKVDYDWNFLTVRLDFVACWQWITRLIVIETDSEGKRIPKAVGIRGYPLKIAALAIGVERTMV